MTVGNTKIAVWSNNSFLEESFVGQLTSPDISFNHYKDSTSAPYTLIIIDLLKNLKDISQKVIDFYDRARKQDQKLTVILIHGEIIDTEKNIYFTDFLTDLGSDKSLHRLVFVKDLFQASLLYTETSLEKYVLEAIDSRKIIISEKGENTYYPISLSDLITSLKKIFYLQGTAGKNFWILGDPVTDLEIAYLIKKYLEDTEGPEFEIEATASNNKSSLDLNSLGYQSRVLLNWDPKEEFPVVLKEAVYRLKEDRSLLLTKLHHNQKEARYPRLKKIGKYLNSLKKIIDHLKFKKGTREKIETGPELLKKILEYSIATISFVYLILSLIFVSFTTLSLKYLENTLSDLRRGDTSLSVSHLNQSKIFSKIGKGSYSIVSPAVSIFAGSIHEKNYNLFVFLDYSQASLVSLQQTYQLAENIYQTIGGESSARFYEDSSLALRSNLTQIYENLNQIRLLSNRGKLPQILEKKLNSNSEFNNIELIEQQITDLLKTVELLPAFLAGDSAKNIIVLFQNSQEVRSTGGTIDYVLALVMDQGKIVSKNLYRNDEIDSLGIGVVAAPPMVRQLTGEGEWKTRDLNYNPDFPQTAVNISWFLDKFLKIKPDIILAVNDRFISDLLQEDKGILLNGRNVTSDIFHKEIASESTSELYRDLISHYIDRILGHQLSLSSLGRIIAKQSAENQILFWSVDSNIEKSIVSQRYSGAIFPHACHGGLSNSGSCVVQTTYYNESNFSLIPLTEKPQRKILHRVWIEKNQIKHRYQVQYQLKEEIINQIQHLSMVVQLYAPENSMLDRITLDNREILLNNILRQKDNQMERFQIPFSMSLNGTHDFAIDFITPLTPSDDMSLAYTFSEYFQPGMIDQNIELEVNFPEVFRPSIITGAVTSGKNSLNLVLTPKNASFGVGFTSAIH